MDRAKVVVAISIETTLEFADDGYLGTTATIAEHLKKALGDVQACTLLVQRGGTEPKPVTGNITVRRITIIPEEG